MSSVLILLAVYQGEKFLQAQLDSLASQTIEQVHVLASDDGSSDESIKILEAAKRSWAKGKFQIVEGPGKGVAENFRSLIFNTEIDADFYAFCDQDDIWDDDKLKRAIAYHPNMKSDQPHIYGSRTRTVNVTGHRIGLSPLFSKPPTFQNALVQSIAGANTMVMNQAAHTLLRKAIRRKIFVSHDWGAYQIVTGAGGMFHYDAEPHISYRQHGENLVGSNNSQSDRLKRLRRAFGGQMKIWSDQNIALLEECSELLTPSAKSTLQEFKTAHESRSMVSRLKALRRSGVYRQTLAGQISLIVACVLRLL